MKKHLVAAVVRSDEAETFVLDYFLDCAEHAMNSSAADASTLELMPLASYVKSVIHA
jgi:hypothetical protein